MTDEQNDPSHDTEFAEQQAHDPESSSAGADGAAGATGDDQGPSAAAEPRRLYRSRSERVICGVCGGLAEYFDIDPLIFRISWVVFGLMSGLGILAYIVACIFIPERGGASVAKAPPVALRKPRETGMIFGVLLVILGAHFLAEELGIYYRFPFRFWYMPFETMASLAFIGLGGYLIYTGTGARRSSKSNADTGAAAGADTSAAAGAGSGAAQAEHMGDGKASAGATNRRLTRSVDDRKLAGVCGGFASYFNWDPTLVRLGFVLIACATHFLAVIAYGILALVLPEQERGGETAHGVGSSA